MTSLHDAPGVVSSGKQSHWAARLGGALFGALIGFAFRRLAMGAGWMPSDAVVFAVAYFVGILSPELLEQCRRPLGATRVGALVGSTVIAAIMFALLLRYLG